MEHNIDEGSNLKNEFEKKYRENQPVQEPEVIPIIEEQIRVDTRVVESGSVNIRKNVHEEEVTVNLPIINEEIDVERVAINEFVDSAPAPVRYEGDKIIIPVLKEVSVVVKKLMLVEELHVTKRKVETHTSQQVKLRKEEVNISRADGNTANGGL
ncbi:YsnF/AvaK domain-containing protein [Pontibacter harenae]|uniref:YsnF/AvaK domain-containing protein n=1 Tax=Pontibacter harenae TaxID=2894083 RepID=UPI001E2E3A4D|nr:YsnF/AvaK domain-containing protein [Pontibacter harenae]MCC9167573.1 YsnF/AvaK domain-containing protein [Pontibacter harenae]